MAGKYALVRLAHCDEVLGWERAGQSPLTDGQMKLAPLPPR